MKEEQLQRTMASLLVSAFPTPIRAALYRDKQFCADVGITTTASMPLSANLSVQSESLFSALAAAVDGRKSTRIKLADGSQVRVTLGVEKNGSGTLRFGGRGFTFRDASLLSTKRTRRNKALARALESRPLLKGESEHWRKIADKRPFEREEFVELVSALEATPEAVFSSVQRAPSASVEDFLPRTRTYYDRLVAPLNDCLDLINFVSTSLKEARGHALSVNFSLGLRRIAYSNLLQIILPLELLDNIKIGDIAELLNAFDPFSLLFGFELCRYKIDHDVAFEELGTRFLLALLGQDDSLRRRCQVFSACAIFTTVLLRERFEEGSVPLFWFRLVALTHAGLLTDALRSLDEPAKFYEWAIKSFGTSFFWGTNYDRRDAPRWRSEWIVAEQIEAELFGRVRGAIGLLPKGRYPKPWQEIVNKVAARQQERKQQLASSFPGPLDDFGNQLIVPPEMQQVVAEREVSIKSAKSISEVGRLTGFAYLFRSTESIVQELVRLLDTTHSAPINRELLDACAHIAACSRSEALSRSVINQCLAAVRTCRSAKDLIDLYGVMLQACAAVADHRAYRDFLANTSTALVLNIAPPVPMIDIRLIFETLTQRDPKLHSSLSRASANVEAVEMRRQS